MKRYDGGSVTTELFLSYVTETADIDATALLAPLLFETALPPSPAEPSPRTRPRPPQG